MRQRTATRKGGSMTSDVGAPKSISHHWRRGHPVHPPPTLTHLRETSLHSTSTSVGGGGGNWLQCFLCAVRPKGLPKASHEEHPGNVRSRWSGP